MSYLLSYYDTKHLSRDKELRLIKLAQNGKARAMDILVRKNIGYIAQMAGRGQYRNTEVPLDDYLQVAAIGLIRAIYSFDPNRKCRLITLAFFLMRKEITRIAQKAKIVTKPFEEEMFPVDRFSNVEVNEMLDNLYEHDVKMATVIHGYFFEDKTFDVISEEMGISRGWACVLNERGIKYLRKIIK